MADTKPPRLATDALPNLTALLDDIVAGFSDAPERCRADDTDPPVNLLWILAHLVQETARHAGNADILRELIDGETGG